MDYKIKGTTKVISFSNGLPKEFYISSGYTNGYMFNVNWRDTNTTFNNKKMQLTISDDKITTNDRPYAGAEIQSYVFYGYGRYECRMKALRAKGTVSSFFTYTGPSDNNPWDEIDFEVLGKNTKQVQLNYFTSGEGHHEVLIDLGFDAAEDFHEYAFEWTKGQISWYVDGKHVHTATTNIPVTPARIMTNAWCGIGVDDWIEAFDSSNMPYTAEYEWIKFTKAE